MVVRGTDGWWHFSCLEPRNASLPVTPSGRYRAHRIGLASQIGLTTLRQKTKNARGLFQTYLAVFVLLGNVDSPVTCP